MTPIPGCRTPLSDTDKVFKGALYRTDTGAVFTASSDGTAGDLRAALGTTTLTRHDDETVQIGPDGRLARWGGHLPV